MSSQTTNAMMGIYGVADNARAEALAQRIVDNDPALLAYGSPYGLYYVLELFDRFGAPRVHEPRCALDPGRMHSPVVLVHDDLLWVSGPHSA